MKSPGCKLADVPFILAALWDTFTVIVFKLSLNLSAIIIAVMHVNILVKDAICLFWF